MSQPQPNPYYVASQWSISANFALYVRVKENKGLNAGNYSLQRLGKIEPNCRYSKKFPLNNGKLVPVFIFAVQPNATNPEDLQNIAMSEEGFVDFSKNFQFTVHPEIAKAAKNTNKTANGSWLKKFLKSSSGVTTTTPVTEQVTSVHIPTIDEYKDRTLNSSIENRQSSSSSSSSSSSNRATTLNKQGKSTTQNPQSLPTPSINPSSYLTPPPPATLSRLPPAFGSPATNLAEAFGSPDCGTLPVTVSQTMSPGLDYVPPTQNIDKPDSPSSHTSGKSNSSSKTRGIFDFLILFCHECKFVVWNTGNAGS